MPWRAVSALCVFSVSRARIPPRPSTAMPPAACLSWARDYSSPSCFYSSSSVVIPLLYAGFRMFRISRPRPATFPVCRQLFILMLGAARDQMSTPSYRDGRSTGRPDGRQTFIYRYEHPCAINPLHSKPSLHPARAIREADSRQRTNYWRTRSSLIHHAHPARFWRRAFGAIFYLHACHPSMESMLRRGGRQWPMDRAELAFEFGEIVLSHSGLHNTHPVYKIRGWAKRGWSYV